jgi:Xaa-Pro aminopeptidase
MVCVKDESTEFGNFLRFETLTVCPIDTNAIEKSQLTPVEIDWINHYHRWVYDELSPLVNNELKAYLKGLTKEI